MKSRAAVAFKAGAPLEIAEVDVQGPRAGEVMVEIKATGVCHTDAFTLSGDDPEGALVDGGRYYFADSDNNRIVRYVVVVN